MDEKIKRDCEMKASLKLAWRTAFDAYTGSVRELSERINALSSTELETITEKIESNRCLAVKACEDYDRHLDEHQC